MASRALSITPKLKSPTMIYPAESSQTTAQPITPSFAINVKIGVADA